MSTPADKLAVELRNEIEARIQSWKNERDSLLLAPARIAELDRLIAFAEDPANTQFRVAPRPPTPPIGNVNSVKPTANAVK